MSKVFHVFDYSRGFNDWTTIKCLGVPKQLLVLRDPEMVLGKGLRPLEICCPRGSEGASVLLGASSFMKSGCKPFNMRTYY